MARRGMTNYLQFRIADMDLSTCTNLTLMIEQCGTTYTYTGTANADDSELMDVTIPKSDAVKFKNIPAKFQVAITDANGIPRSHEPVIAMMGDLLEVTGYGS